MIKLWVQVGRGLYVGLQPLWQRLVKGSQRTRLLVIHEGQVLVVQQWLGDGRWSLPGGGLHTGESIATGAQRELREETGLQLDAAQIMPLAEEVYAEQGFSYTAQYCYAQLMKAPKVQPRWPEIRAVAWYRPIDLTVLNASTEVLRALHLGGTAGRNLLQ